MTDAAGTELRQSWDKIAQRLKAELGDDLYTSWFARMEPEECADGRLAVSVPTHGERKRQRMGMWKFWRRSKSAIESIEPLEQEGSEIGNGYPPYSRFRSLSGVSETSIFLNSPVMLPLRTRCRARS